MNHERMHQCGDDEERSDDGKKRRIYRVDATKICKILTRKEKKSFAELLHLTSINQPEEPVLSFPNLISIAIHWNRSQCTTSDIENFISIIDPLICLRQLYADVPNSGARHQQVNLIGLICFYGTTIEVFFSYDYSTLKWHFCLDGNLTIMNDWNVVQRKCIDFHLQPFLLIYANSQVNSIDTSQLLRRTVIQTTVVPSASRLEDPKHAMMKQEQLPKTKTSLQRDCYSFDNLSKISSFATLNSSMLFLPQSTSSSSTYINQATVAKVMQQQLLKKESLVSSPLRPPFDRKQISDDADSSTSSSQRDSGLGSGGNDGSSDDSLAENEPTEIDCLIKQIANPMKDHDVDLTLASIEYYLDESLKYESGSNYSSALESCQRARLLVEQILHLHDQYNTDLAIYARTRKNGLLLRIHSLRKRQIRQEEFNSPENVEKQTKNLTTSILSSTTRLSRPKKNVKFSDKVALIVPISDDNQEPPSEHLIHSFLRQIHQQQNTSDSDTSSLSSSNDSLIGLSECSLCHKRFSRTNQLETFCSNCHFYMQRFRPSY